MISKKSISLLLSFLMVLAVGFLAGFWMPADDEYFALRKNFQIFGALYEELVTGYVDPLNPETLMRSGIDAMLQDLDPYTNFFDEADNGDIDIITRGRYGGVGLNIGVRNGSFTVVSPVEGASGYVQGVKAGDIVIEADGQDVSQMSITDLRNILRGEPGTAVPIVIAREGTEEPIEFVLTREDVRLKNVTHSGFLGEGAGHGIGYVKLERFAQDATRETHAAIKALQEEGHLNGLILDLRDNPGGLLSAAVEITELFVPHGSTIVSTRGRLAASERVYKSTVNPLAPDVPLVILINGISASASEIVAGAIQDLDRGVVLGTSSYGKGLVQIVKPLPYNTSLKMTTSQYFIPSGRSIQAIDYKHHDGNFEEIPDSLRRTYRTAAGRTVKDGRGIEPDVLVAPEAQSELEQALTRRAAFFFFANHFAATHDTIPVDFVVDDEVYGRFRQWLDEKAFSYRTAAERTAEELAEHLSEMTYDEAGDEMESLQEAIQTEKALDFERHKESLKERLRTQILARYYGDSAQVEASLAHDAQYAEAIRILQQPDTYAAFLGSR